jgi:branched-subunit amino acid transport protein
MIWLAILGMTLATYLPRLAPFVLGRRLSIPEAVARWLEFFPFAVLGALIVPGILTATPEPRWLGAATGLFAAALSLVTRNVTLVVVAAIGFAYLMQRLF